MPPRDNHCYHHYDSLEERAAIELEGMRTASGSKKLHPMPPACKMLVRSLPGNAACMDCGARHPEWATVSYGALICLECSGKHRSLGVQTSTVRSIVMDHWSHEQVLALLEGGNEQLSSFFSRHHMDKLGKRYKTKAAQFYRQELEKHAHSIMKCGLYQGRKASRTGSPSPPMKQQHSL